MKKKYVCLFILLLSLFLNSCAVRGEENKKMFDLDNMKFSSSPDSADTASYLPKTNPHYSTIMERVLKRGIIVAGYATGLREAAGAYTVTTFEVKDIFYGTPAGKTIKIKERYEVVQQDGLNMIYYHGINTSKLRNGGPYLLFLLPDDKETGYYYMECEFLNLMPDYKEFNDEYVKSICDFYRGNPSAYYSETGEWQEKRDVSYINDKGEKISETVNWLHSVKMWPSKNISDQELLKEQEENLLVRTAMEFKVAIWPYGHKNYDVAKQTTISDDMIRCSSYYPEGQVGYPWGSETKN